MQFKFKNEVDLVKLELKSGGAGGTQGNKDRERANAVPGQTSDEALYWIRLRVTVILDFTLCAAMLGDEFAVLAFSRSQTGDWMYDRMTPRMKFEPHTLTLFIDESLTYDPVRCAVGLDKIEPYESDKVLLSLSLGVRVTDERILLHLARRLGKELQVFIEPAQMALDLGDDQDDSLTFDEPAGKLTVVGVGKDGTKGGAKDIQKIRDKVKSRSRARPKPKASKTMQKALAEVEA